MNEKLEKIAEALDWELSKVTPETHLDELDWDSMAMLTVIAIARTNGKPISGVQVRAMKTVRDVMAAI